MLIVHGVFLSITTQLWCLGFFILFFFLTIPDQKNNFFFYSYIEKKHSKHAPMDGRFGMKYGHKRVSDLANYLSHLGAKQGDQMPDKATIRLPTCMTLKNAYKDYQDEYRNPFSLRHFQRIWKERCPDMKASEVN